MSADAVLVRERAAAPLGHTVQWYKEADGALRDPLADAVAGALLNAGDQGGVVDYAVEYLALGRFGGAHGGHVGAGPWRMRAAAHVGWSVRVTSEGGKRGAKVVARCESASEYVECVEFLRSMCFANRGWQLRSGQERFSWTAIPASSFHRASGRGHCMRARLSQRSE